MPRIELGRDPDPPDPELLELLEGAPGKGVGLQHRGFDIRHQEGVVDADLVSAQVDADQLHALGRPHLFDLLDVSSMARIGSPSAAVLELIRVNLTRSSRRVPRVVLRMGIPIEAKARAPGT